MSYVETRNQNRKEVIKMIRSFLVAGDQTKIKERIGISIRAVNDTLNEEHPLYSKKVINECWAYLVEQGRIKRDQIIISE